MGGGDWNDGMDKVGIKGRGDSVWLGWFLYTVLDKFIPICQHHNDGERAQKYKDVAEKLKEAINKHGWDGGWYRRAYFDDGTPLGSELNEECRIGSYIGSRQAFTSKDCYGSHGKASGTER